MYKRYIFPIGSVSLQTLTNTDLELQEGRKQTQLCSSLCPRVRYKYLTYSLWSISTS